jgi:hypothetical protein
VPQLLGSAFKFTSHPLVRALPSQFANPALHAIKHDPRLQLAVPFAVLHAWLQPPQCATVVCVLTSQPLA